METLEELRTALRSAQWYSRLDQPFDHPWVICVSNLERPEIDEPWWWITSILLEEEQDPFHGEFLNVGSQRVELTRDIVKIALASYRTAPEHPALRAFGWDHYEAAKLCLMHACRFAAREIVLEQQGGWSLVVDLFCRGHYPFGVAQSGRTVVLGKSRSPVSTEAWKYTGPEAPPIKATARLTTYESYSS